MARWHGGTESSNVQAGPPAANQNALSSADVQRGKGSKLGLAGGAPIASRPAEHGGTGAHQIVASRQTTPFRGLLRGPASLVASQRLVPLQLPLKPSHAQAA
ncbi:hypothetical protein E4U53_001074 [Claviceps sorghi]|nr:hypothetical protein E4U53_001074 [Claviceps sorghi]